MKNSKLKSVICLLWIFGVIGFVLFQESRTATAKKSESVKLIPKPDLKEVENFNTLIQQRFLTEPGFGSARIQPSPPYSKHVESFYPKGESEKKAVEEFERKGWKVGLYLYGKRTEKEIKNSSEQKKFLINYRLKQPVIITKNIKKREELSNSSRILKKVKDAFSQFQESEQSDNTFEFESGDWWYFAKPVRAVNESCVQCHTDYVMVKKLDKNNYQFRKRKIGDVNGVLVYAFQKVKK